MVRAADGRAAEAADPLEPLGDGAVRADDRLRAVAEGDGDVVLARLRRREVYEIEPQLADAGLAVLDDAVPGQLRLVYRLVVGLAG